MKGTVLQIHGDKRASAAGLNAKEIPDSKAVE
jgi:hypothetical protein